MINAEGVELMKTSSIVVTSWQLGSVFTLAKLHHMQDLVLRPVA